MHDGFVRHDAPAPRVEAATRADRRVVVANDVPKLDLARLIRSINLPNIAWQTKRSTTTTLLLFC